MTRRAAAYRRVVRQFKRRAYRYLFALRVGVWLCWLPISLRRQHLHMLLRHAGNARHAGWPALDMADAVGVVRRVCHLPLFRPPLFPRACLRESLALFCILTRLGYPVCFHIGVRWETTALSGHSWITHQGRSLNGADDRSSFATIYSYP